MSVVFAKAKRLLREAFGEKADRPMSEVRVLDQVVKDVVALQLECPKDPMALKEAVMQRIAASGVGRAGDLDAVMARIESELAEQEFQNGGCSHA